MSSSLVPTPKVRPFRREDRDQLTDLVNAHAAVVLPGVSVSVNTVLSRLQRQPDEFVTDPWVAERVTLVAEQRQSIAAAAHLLRYRAAAEVDASYRDAGVIEWLVCRPQATFLPDTEDACDLLMAACLVQLARWQVSIRYADGALPVPGLYGVPEQWPHIRSAYERAGFVHTGDTEVLLMAAVADLPRAGQAPPLAGVSAERTLGECGTRFSARLGTRVIGFIEVDTLLDRPERHARIGGLADMSGLHVDREYGGTGLTQWLVAHAAQWLRSAGRDRVLTYASPDDTDEIDQQGRLGFQELARTRRGWEHQGGRR
jgi:GNAT superfamily N-acetyltransferase